MPNAALDVPVGSMRAFSLASGPALRGGRPASCRRMSGPIVGDRQELSQNEKPGNESRPSAYSVAPSVPAQADEDTRAEKPPVDVVAGEGGLVSGLTATGERSQDLLTGYPRQYWLMVAGVLISQAGGSMIWSFLLIYVSGKLNMSLAAVATLVTIQSSTTVVSSFVAGTLADPYRSACRYGREPRWRRHRLPADGGAGCVSRVHRLDGASWVSPILSTRLAPTLWSPT